MNIAQQLEQFGLDDKETKIYLALLGLGTASISDIAKKAGVKRPTTYLYIEDLLQKQLIYRTVKGKRTFYVAHDPQKIMYVLDEKRKNLEKILPELQSVHKLAFNQPKIRFYEGKEGLKNIYNEFFATSFPVYGAFSADKFYEVFDEEFNAHIFDLMRENGGQIYDLVEKTKFSESYIKKKQYKKDHKAKLLPDDFKMATDMLVAEDKVALISFDNLSGVVIEDADIAETHRQFLKFMWKSI
jgi:sugar-specific transcriptional regulator TrmB